MEQSVDNERIPDLLALIPKNIPLVPPKQHASSLFDKLYDPDNVNSWYFVQDINTSASSELIEDVRPHSIIGPKSVNDLRKLYKYKEIEDSTLMWSDGMSNWIELSRLHGLRFRLLNVPPVPPKSVKKEADNIVLSHTDFEKFTNISMDKKCCKCGGVAVGHMKNSGEQLPDFISMREEVGVSSKVASEIIPGFLWIGNSSASRKGTVGALQFTLLINCTDNLKGPESNPPYYRCVDLPMQESPDNRSQEFVNDILEKFEAIYHILERERVYFERASLGDESKGPYRGPKDKFGRPLRRSSDMNPTKPTQSRVLVWSQQGFNRACVVVASYIIRQWRTKLSNALEVIEAGRPGMNIGRIYRNALKLWSAKFVEGTYFCADCVSISNTNDISEESEVNVQAEQSHSMLVSEISKEVQEHFNFDPHTMMPTIFECIETNEPTTVTDSLREVRVHRYHHHLNTVKYNIYDLKITGVNLSNDMFDSIFRLLVQKNLLHRIRCIDFSSNSFDCKGVFHLVEAYKSLQFQTSELIVLNLANNRIGIDGGKYLGDFLRNQQSMITLDVSNNNLLDDGGVSILLAIGDDPEELMLGNQDDVNVNTSLTSLNISSNELGIKSADAIGKVFRNNPYLTALNIDNNPNLPKLEMKNAMETMRLCNLSMEQLSSSYNTQSVRSFFHIMRLLEYPEPPIKRLTLSKCRIGPGHLTHAKKCLMNAKTVEKLDLSMNELGDEGMEQLYLAFSGITSARMHEEEDEENSTGFGFASSTDSLSKASMHQYHKIQHLDISCCSFSKSGASNVFRMVTSLNHLSYLDMSENNIGPDCMTENIEHIISCRLRVLKLNRCQLKSKGAKVLLDIMSNSFRKNERPPFFYDAKIARRDSRLLKRSGLDNPRLAALAIDLMENHDTYDILRPEIMSMASRSTDDNEVLHEISMPALIVRPIDRNELSEDSSNHILSQRADVHLDMNQSEESSIANKINLLYDSLQVLTLADNDICDSITPSLTKLLETNMTLEYLDLGFNKFSSHAMEMVKPALRVSSESILEKKINSLYVNLVGNENCEDYMLETPGLTRSKITLNYNSKSLALNKLNRPLQSKNDNTNKQFHLIPDYRNVIS